MADGARNARNLTTVNEPTAKCVVPGKARGSPVEPKAATAAEQIL